MAAFTRLPLPPCQCFANERESAKNSPEAPFGNCLWCAVGRITPGTGRFGIFHKYKHGRQVKGAVFTPPTSEASKWSATVSVDWGYTGLDFWLCQQRVKICGCLSLHLISGSRMMVMASPSTHPQQKHSQAAKIEIPSALKTGSHGTVANWNRAENQKNYQLRKLHLWLGIYVTFL